MSPRLTGYSSFDVNVYLVSSPMEAMKFQISGGVRLHRKFYVLYNSIMPAHVRTTRCGAVSG